MNTMSFDLQPTLKGELLELRPLQGEDFDDLYSVAADPLIWEQHPSKDRGRRSHLSRRGIRIEGALNGQHNLPHPSSRKRARQTFPEKRFFSVVMKWALSQEGPGNPVSPGSNRRVVGPSAPWLPNGIIKTESTLSLRLRASRDTINTQCRAAGVPNIAVQISPRRGRALRLIKVDLLRRGT